MQPAQISFLELLDGTVQYVVPRWQRRYRWGKSDIERLIDDLRAVARAGGSAAHYAGTLLTFPEPGPPGVVRTIRVVDGQQRLTTVSILLACIAEKLGPEGAHGEWTAQIIRDDRLTNPGKPRGKHRKLRLQEGDEDEYRRGLEGQPTGAGAVTQAWKIVQRIVARSDPGQLIEGLQRLRVVGINLDEHEDPQQIFESLNATGRPLTESEKVKNWLLMGLPDAEQQDLHDNYWLVMEQALGAEHGSEPTDIFLRDLLRWRTGELVGIDRVYENLRRWLAQNGKNHGDVGDRVALCRELTRQARLYGLLTGSAGRHSDRKVEGELRHFRAMGIHVHRPLSLRLLNETRETDSETTNDQLARILGGIAVWLTRLWLAERQTAGMNKAVAELAYGPGPRIDEDTVEYWLERIRRRRNTRVGVPSDEEVQRGIRTRKAYGASATQSSFAVLCALMEAELGPESPARAKLTIEHVMPQKLSPGWERDLGDTAHEIHDRWRHRIPNLTLSGWNTKLSNRPFAEKRRIYKDSPIGLTREIADEAEWNEATLERRAERLADRALERWPWLDPDRESGAFSDPPEQQLQWRFEGGPWHVEQAASQMVSNVAGALLSVDRRNAERLAGEAIISNLHPASRYPAGSKVGTLTMRAVPGHEDFVLFPYARDYSASAKRCRDMGERCGVSIEVKGVARVSRPQLFFRFLKERRAGFPGQKDSWRGANQWTSPLNSPGDRIGIFVGEETLWLYIRAGDRKASEGRTTRMQRYSRMIANQMADQETVGNPADESRQGRSVSIERLWILEDEDEWPEAAEWLQAQHQRLQTILADPVASGGASH